MQAGSLKVVLPFFAAMMLAAGGSALAANSSTMIDADRTLSQAEPPVDCKKAPEDARCKDKKK